MGVAGACQVCGRGDGGVEARGRFRVLAVLCDSCWNRVANDLAEDEGATAAPPGERDGDDVAWVEPAACGRCGRPVRVVATNYDRWVSLEWEERPVEEVPARFRWRLRRRFARGSGVMVDVVAVRMRGVDPWLAEWVVPAHGMACPAEAPPGGWAGLV